jgi:tetratricopeptide (TPR) repeat protein
MEAGEMAATLLRQGRCQTACRLLDGSLAAKAESYGVQSAEYRHEGILAVHLLLDSALCFIESGQLQNTFPLLSKVEALLAPETAPLGLPDQSRIVLAATLSFLRASIDKQQRRYESALQLYIDAAARFEASERVTELCLSYVGAAHCLLELQKEQEAIGYATNAKDLLSSPECSKAVANPVHEALALGYLRQNETALAEEELKEAIQNRHLESQLRIPKPAANEGNPGQCSSTQNIPAPPSGPRGRNMRARMMKQRTERKQLAQQSAPLRELGHLQLSVSRLVNCT